MRQARRSYRNSANNTGNHSSNTDQKHMLPERSIFRSRREASAVLWPKDERSGATKALGVATKTTLLRCTTSTHAPCLDILERQQWGPPPHCCESPGVRLAPGLSFIPSLTADTGG